MHRAAAYYHQNICYSPRIINHEINSWKRGISLEEVAMNDRRIVIKEAKNGFVNMDHGISIPLMTTKIPYKPKCTKSDPLF